jgi:hypothetical protein
MRLRGVSFVMRVAAPFLNISRESIPSQYSSKFAVFSKYFIFS